MMNEQNAGSGSVGPPTMRSSLKDEPYSLVGQGTHISEFEGTNSGFHAISRAVGTGLKQMFVCRLYSLPRDEH